MKYRIEIFLVRKKKEEKMMVFLISLISNVNPNLHGSHYSWSNEETPHCLDWYMNLEAAPILISGCDILYYQVHLDKSLTLDSGIHIFGIFFFKKYLYK